MPLIGCEILRSRGRGDFGSNRLQRDRVMRTIKQGYKTMKKSLPAMAIVLALPMAQSWAQATGEGPTETDQDEWQEPAEEADESVLRGELYGFVMLDMGYNDGTINEDWYDVMRPSKLPKRRQNSECATSKFA